MITLKTGAYSPKEMDMLNKLLYNTVDTLYKNTCERQGHEPNCPNCEYKHLCADLNSVAVYRSDIVKKIAEGNNG